MKNVKLYKWLTVTLMLAISVFCLLYLEKIQKSTAPAVAETKPKNTAETDKPERPVFYNTLPKNAYSYNGQQFQNIGGDDDDILKNVHTFGKTAYVFFDTSSNGYDVKTAAPSVACALVDENLTLKKTVTLSGDGAEYYLSSKITGDGFFVLTKSDSYVALYKMNFDLVVINRTVFEKEVDGTLHLQTNGRLLSITTSDSSLSVRVIGRDGVIEKSSSIYLSSPKIVLCYEKDETVNMFVNLEKSFVEVRYSDFYGFLSSDETVGKTIDEILPFNGGFAGIYLENGEKFLFTADENAVVSFEKQLPPAGFTKILKNGENLMLVSSQNGKTTLSLFCTHLDEVITRTYDSETTLVPYFDESGRIALFDGEHVTLYSYDAVSIEKIEKYPASAACVKVFESGIVAFSANKKDGAFNKNYGKSDVFITVLKKNTTK